MIIKKFLLLIFGMFLLISTTYKDAFAAKKIILATAEHEPYVGENLPDKGYVHELIFSIYQRMGYEVEIHFYPLARAKFLAIHGMVDGYFPTHFQASQQQDLAFSAPFTGDNIGLLKKKSLQISSNTALLDTVEEQLYSLKHYEFGVVRGADISPVFNNADYLTKQYATNNIQNLDKLMKGRIDFAVGDRYTLADIMVAQRPNFIGQLDFLPSPHFNNAFHLAFSKRHNNYQQLKSDFNTGLKLLTQDGTLTKILTKHGLFPAHKNTIKLTIGTVNNSDMLIMKSLSKDFEKAHPQIKLYWRVLSETTLRKRLLSDLAISDGQFDIMTIGSYEAALWAKQGWLTALKNIPLTYEINDVLANVRDILSYQKQLYALPFYAESSMMFYRQDLFDQHNITMPEQPTYDDVIHFAKTIHDPSNEVYGICIRGKAGWGENIAAFTPIVNTHSGRWFNDKWQPMINSLPWKKALATYIKLITLYSPPDAYANGFNENLKLFSNGYCGMWIDATVAAATLFDAKKSAVFDKIKYTTAPIADIAEGAHWLWVWSLAIPESSKHKSAALKFITWATSKNYIDKVAAQEGWLAVPPGTRKSTYENNNYLQQAPFVSFVLKNIQDGRPLANTAKTTTAGETKYTSIPEFHTIGNYIGSLLVDVIKGKITQQQALEKAQQFAEKIMIKSGHYQK